jgi:electron transfer flavoprotein beta subunit
MRIVVCICQVPDIASVVTVVDGRIDLSRLSRVMNPYDEYAVEEAVRLKELLPGSEVTVMTATEETGRDLLRKALAMGADRAFELLSPSLEDSFQIASVLSGAIRERYADALPDLVLCGRESFDHQNAAVPAMLAGMLGIAFTGPVTAISASGEIVEFERETESGIECLQAAYPLVVSAEKGLNIPRKTGIRQVMEARKKPIETISVSQPPASLLRLQGVVPVSAEKNCRFATNTRELAGLLLRDGCIPKGEE